MSRDIQLSGDEIERYARHIVMPEIGGAGQKRLKSSRILVVGAGGLGAPVLQYLGAAGIGTISVVDDDRVALSNLQRQTIFATNDLGAAKAGAAARFLEQLNPHLEVHARPFRINAENALDLIDAHDLVIDGSDNFATRYLVSDACFFGQKPLVSGAVGRFDGMVTLLKPYLCDDEGTPLPTYRCLNPSAPPPGSLAPCVENGIIGAVPGVIGALMAMEALKEVLGLGETLLGRLLLYDSLTPRFQHIVCRHSRANPLTGVAPLSFAALHGTQPGSAAKAPGPE